MARVTIQNLPMRQLTAEEMARVSAGWNWRAFGVSTAGGGLLGVAAVPTAAAGIPSVGAFLLGGMALGAVGYATYRGGRWIYRRVRR